MTYDVGNASPTDQYLAETPMDSDVYSVVIANLQMLIS